MPDTHNPILALTAQIVSAHVENNDTPAAALPGLIREVYRALAGTSGAAHVRPSLPRASGPAAPAPMPAHITAPMASPVAAPMAAPAAARKAARRQTVFDDRLVCMDCGLSMKMLKRHLQTVHGVSPSQYRARWNLAGDYPMVARQYAALRSSLAKKSGLGKRPVPREC